MFGKRGNERPDSDLLTMSIKEPDPDICDLLTPTFVCASRGTMAGGGVEAMKFQPSR